MFAAGASRRALSSICAGAPLRRARLALAARAADGASRSMATLPGFVQAVVMPALSPTMTTGKVAKWHVEPRAKVEPGSVLCEIETDKASLDFEVQDEGFIAQLLVQAGSGDDLPVGRPIALLVEDESMLEQAIALDYAALMGAKPGASAPSAAGAATPAAAAPAAPDHSALLSPTRIMPSARHMVESLHINPAVILGTGKGGRITKGDVLAFVRGGSVAPPPAAAEGDAPAVPAEAAPAPVASRPTPFASAPAAAPPVSSAPAPSAPRAPAAAVAVPPADARGVADKTPSQMRKVIARRLTESKAGVPHAYATMEVELEALLKVRSQLKGAGAAVSVNDMIVRAVALALRDMPAVNAYFDEPSGSVRARTEVDVSVAVATEGGLITPIVRNAADRGLAAIAADVRELAGRARDNKLLPHEYQGGSFSVSNLGMFGIDEFSAVINPPQAGILAVSRGAPRVVPREQTVREQREDGTVEERRVVRPATSTVMSMTLSTDRRVVDEAQAAQFLQLVREYLLQPTRMAL